MRTNTISVSKASSLLIAGLCLAVFLVFYSSHRVQAGDSGTVTTVYLTSGTSWSVPSDWNSANNTIEVIGGGGGASAGTASFGGGSGGGGGAYSKISNLSLTPGGSVAYAVGTGGAGGTSGGNGTAGGDTYFCNSTSNCASISGTAVQVGAKGGGGSTKTSGNGNATSGGASASGVGTTKYSGGASVAATSNGGSGGGGAGGPNGNGASGGASSSFPSAGGGGGGNGGGSTGSNASGTTGGAGGNNSSGSGGGAASTNGSAGGGGGGASVSGNPGAGGTGQEWDSTHGSGGGGGGGFLTSGNVGSGGGAGGSYGGGGGGAGGGGTYAGTGGAGAQGIIVIRYYARSLTFNGNVQLKGNLIVTGSLSKGSGTFQIDNPANPSKEILFHSFVESNEVKNIYNGTATLDEKGEAVIQLPEYYDVLNKTTAYQFTPLNEAMPYLYLKSEEKDNRFAIGGGKPGGKISWQITGVRHDPYILKHPLIVEKLKTGDPVKRGQCLFEPLCQ